MKRGDWLWTKNRNKTIDFLKAGTDTGGPLTVVADLLGFCRRTLRRWRLYMSGQGFGIDCLLPLRIEVTDNIVCITFNRN
jgi:hypothetical protein